MKPCGAIGLWQCSSHLRILRSIHLPFT